MLPAVNCTNWLVSFFSTPTMVTLSCVPSRKWMVSGDPVATGAPCPRRVATSQLTTTSAASGVEAPGQRADGRGVRLRGRDGGERHGAVVEREVVDGQVPLRVGRLDAGQAEDDLAVALREDA